MKTRKITEKGQRRIALLGILFLGLGGARLGAQQIPFAVGEWPPYTGSRLENGGMATELVAAAARAADMQAIISFVPWRRAEATVAAGRSFATFPYQITGEREERYLFSDIIFTSNFIVAYRTGALPERGSGYRRPEDFQGLLVGVVAGTDAVTQPLARAGVTVIEVQDPMQLVKMLEAGRLDFAIDDELVFARALTEAAARGISTLPEPFGNRCEFRLMVSREYPGAEALLERFNRGLSAIRGSGEAAAIAGKYGTEGSPAPHDGRRF